MREYLVVAGINTGNSLDGADAVVSRFGLDGSIEDLASHSAPYPPALASAMRLLRATLKAHAGLPHAAIADFERTQGAHAFASLCEQYTAFNAQCLNTLLQRFQAEPVDVVGFHGQTCAHLPPSVARAGNLSQVYTFQLGDGQALADAVDLPVVFDFRSDDLMNGGEGAPLAPHHHQHLSQHLKQRGAFPIAFINGGNTANFTFISRNEGTGEAAILGWDAGPFNELPDQLVRLERGALFDRDGAYGREGQVSPTLLRRLFDHCAQTERGENFLLLPPPKSSDPQWYQRVPELFGDLPFADRVRTAEYFGAYVCYFALSQLPAHLQMPLHFALCGGGWKNPLTREHFSQLVRGDWAQLTLLDEHRAAFETTRKRLLTQNAAPSVRMSEAFGMDGSAMEARVFADAAFCRIKGEAFTLPEVTGVKQPTVCGLLRFPQKSMDKASPPLVSWLEHFGTLQATVDRPDLFDARWSRASAGWWERLWKAK